MPSQSQFRRQRRRISTVFIAPDPLVFLACDPFANRRHVLALLFRVLRRAEVEGELVDLAGKLERHVVAVSRNATPVRVSCPTSKSSSSGNMMGVVYSIEFFATSLPSPDSTPVPPLPSRGRRT